MGLYNRQAAADYALKWALSRNPRFGDFSASSGGGGDCTNFISQCLLAGGWTMNGGRTHDFMSWFVTRRERAHPWVSASGFFQYLRWSGRGMECPEEDLQIGDLASFTLSNFSKKPNHWMIVTGFVSTPEGPEACVSYHSHDTLNSPLSAVRARAGLDADFRYWSLADNFNQLDLYLPSDG